MHVYVPVCAICEGQLIDDDDDEEEEEGEGGEAKKSPGGKREGKV